MTTAQRATIAPGRRIEVNLRGRRFYAAVTARSGAVLTFEPEQPPAGTKGARVNYFTCDVRAVVWASPRWAPEDAVRTAA